MYLDWVEQNRKRVDELSHGRIGYMHLPDMGAAGIREFIKWYYPQLRKEALLIDDRANGGGNISRMVIERLSRTSCWRPVIAHHRRRRGTYPDSVFIGPKAVLLDGNSASDGDIFPWMFRTAKLGPLIGERSWGGVVGITDHGQLIDGGTVNVPEFAYATAKGEWAVEGHGVDPDIVVENDREIGDRRPRSATGARRGGTAEEPGKVQSEAAGARAVSGEAEVKPRESNGSIPESNTPDSFLTRQFAEFAPHGTRQADCP